jgi:hypothetical protein
MSFRLVTSAAAALLVTGAVAHAQSSSSSSSATSNPASSGAAASQQQATGGSQGGADRMRAMSQDKLRQVLSQAGFQDIRVVDAAYIIQARTQDGDTVMMFLNPPSVDATASTSPSQGAGTTGSPSGAASGSQLPGSAGASSAPRPQTNPSNQ